MLNKEDIDELVNHENQIRLKYKRCKTCRFLKLIKTKTYVFDNPTHIYKCLYTNKIFDTAWMYSWGRKGCFCKFYKPEFVTIKDYKEFNEDKNI